MLPLIVTLLFTGSALAADNTTEYAAQFKSSAASLKLNNWDFLNFTLGGRLGSSLPVSAPCFDTVNGKKTGNNSAASVECTAVQDGYSNAFFRSNSHGAQMLPQWEGCQRTSEQCLLDLANRKNPAAWTEFECKQGSISPHYIEIKSAKDVQVVYAFSLLTGIHLSIKNSGHDFKGRSTSKGSLSLWTHGLQSLTHSKTFVSAGCPKSKSYHSFTAGAGVAWDTVYKYGDANGFTAIGGYHQTVGASGGWLLGGGHSILSPVYGLGVDRVLQFKVVTPDGVYRTANECQNQDLFWALRGGGGSTFGVVLESTQRVEPAMKLQVASILFPQTKTNPERFFELVVEKSVQWGKNGWGGHIGGNNIINVTPNLSLEEAKEDLKDVAAYALSQNGTVVIEEVPSWNAFFEKYVPTAQVAVGSMNLLGTQLIKTSVFETEKGRADLVKTLMGLINVSVQPYIVLGTPFLYKGQAGETSVTPAWRDSLWHFGMRKTLQFDSTLEYKQAQYDEASRIAQTMRDVSPNSGAYFNEGDLYEPNHEFAFWGNNYPRLLSIKKRHDPFGLLTCWQCVGWKGAEDEKFSCYL